jgi:hypothetical protein
MYYIFSYYYRVFTRNVPILDIFVQLSSSSNRFGRIRERDNKQTNPKDSRFRVSISKRPSDLLGQRTHTHTHP